MIAIATAPLAAAPKHFLLPNGADIALARATGARGHGEDNGPRRRDSVGRKISLCTDRTTDPLALELRGDCGTYAEAVGLDQELGEAHVGRADNQDRGNCNRPDWS